MKINRVAILQHDVIAQAGISPSTCVRWVEDSFKMKPEAILPPKISIHPQGDDFFNTMPALLAPDRHRFAVKEVHRIAGQEPSLGSDILLYDSHTGDLLAIMDGDWITTMRTGAVAAMSIRLLERNDVTTYSFMGLGNTARATALCLIHENEHRPIRIRLLRYKDQAESFIERFSGYNNVSFQIIDDVNEFVAGADVLVSCITSARGLVCENHDCYHPGMLLIPVHTRGFQNCDLFFDKIYGDDRGHVQGFKYFTQFKQFDEMSSILLGSNPGRETDQERILCYNIGLGLHDALFASRIYDMLAPTCETWLEQRKETKKFWI